MKAPRSARHRLLNRVHILPSLLTLGNFSCGIISIVLCLNALFFSTRAQTLEEKGHTLAATAFDEAGMSPDDRMLRRNMAALHSPDGGRARAETLFWWACLVIFLGMLFDMLDGKVARHMGADSAFGVELDSLADVTTFGVAPAIIVNTISLAVMPVTYAWWSQVIIFGVIFAVCAVLRLARYNIQKGTSDKNIFSGLPAPAAAGCVVSAVLLSEANYSFVDGIAGWLTALPGFGATVEQAKARMLSFFLLLPGLLMVTTVPFVHVANRFLSGRKSFSILVLFVLVLALVWQEPWIMLFLIFNGYMAFGLFVAVRKRWFRTTVNGGGAMDSQ